MCSKFTEFLYQSSLHKNKCLRPYSSEWYMFPLFLPFFLFLFPFLSVSLKSECVFSGFEETLSRIGDLFGALQKAGISLPLSFDMDYFCSGLDIIIDTEHHQLIAKLISVIYNHADVFVGYHRKKLFIDFFITKYFFKFFLHWDESVRNYFHQLIIFKVYFRVSTHV